jgi:hypothetical protein
MTVEVETPDGVRTGSTVIEERAHKSASFPGPDAGGITGSTRGEAVAVDLGTQGVLFALLRPEHGEASVGGYAWALLPNPPIARAAADAVEQKITALKSVRGSAELPRDMYPMLVRFQDASDPASVQQVKPEDLAQFFGPGVELRRITVEITDAPVTDRIRQRLPWLSRYPEPSLDPNFRPTTTPSFLQRLRHGDFSRMT